jgi:hypothetical protein
MIKALTYPRVPYEAYKIYDFFRREMFPAVRYIPGMTPVPHYIDKQYLRIEMKNQINDDLDKYLFFVTIFQEKMFALLTKKD